MGHTKRLLLSITIGFAVVLFLISVTVFLVLLRQFFPFPPSSANNDSDAPVITNLLPTENNSPTTTPSPVAIFVRQTIDEDPPTTSPTESTYIEVTDGCGPHFEGECLNVRSGPGPQYPSVAKLRNGVVLKVSEKIETATSSWYKIIFDEWLRYPERVGKDWYVSAAHVDTFTDVGHQTEMVGSSTKRIVVDRSEQTLAAYDGDVLFMETTISTGIELTPTPRGTFTIFKKTPSRYMQGPLPYLAVSKYYDLPGVPWNLYFTEEGAVIHGAYWHDSFGSRYSSGCVNMKPAEARQLYNWAEVGTTVTVKD